MIDPLELAKMDEHGEQVAKAQAEAALYEAMAAELTTMGGVPADSAYAAMEDGEVFEVGKREGVPGWTEMDPVTRRRALEAVRRIRERGGVSAPPAPASVESDVLDVEVVVVDQEEPAPPPARVYPEVDGMVPSLDGVYIARVPGPVNVPMAGGLQTVRDGAEMHVDSYKPHDFHNCIARGVRFVPRAPAYEQVTLTLRVPDGMEPAAFEEWARSTLANAPSIDADPDASPVDDEEPDGAEADPAIAKGKRKRGGKGKRGR